MIPQPLKDDLSKAAEMLKRHKKVHIFSHYDADGISSAGILAKTFDRLGIEYGVTSFPTLEDRQWAEVVSTDCECMVMSDMGTRYLDEMAKLDRECIVLDHHEGPSYEHGENTAFVNPHTVGINGSSEACASTICYLFAMELGENSDLVQLALTGIMGDKQHIGGFKGLNAEILADSDYIADDGVLIPAGCIYDWLRRSIEPYIVGISGNSDGAYAFLRTLGISKTDERKDLSPEKIESLREAVLSSLLKQGVSQPILDECGKIKRILLKGYGMDAETMSEILDACGRSKRYEEGLEFIRSGDLSVVDAIFDEQRKKLLAGVFNACIEGSVEMDYIQYLINKRPGIGGTVCGIYSRYISDPAKPVIGMTPDKELTEYSLSSRCTNYGVSLGINMAIAIETAAKAVGGSGGGHANAAGGSIPYDKGEEFVGILDDAVGRQVSAGKSV